MVMNLTKAQMIKQKVLETKERRQNQIPVVYQLGEAYLFQGIGRRSMRVSHRNAFFVEGVLK